MDLTLFEFTIERGGNERSQHRSEGESSGKPDKELDVRVVDDPGKKSSGPSWGLVAKVALASVVLTAIATVVAMRRRGGGKGSDDGSDESDSSETGAQEMGSVSKQKKQKKNKKKQKKSGSRIPFLG